MPLSDPLLWSRIERYAFPGPLKVKWAQRDVNEFEATLVREMSVDAEDAKRLILEYRRFIYLKALDGGLLSPPADLDEVWHIHIGYPNKEWEKFCSTVIGRPLEHRTRLSSAEAKAARVKVSQLYHQEFGTPPKDIWPGPAEILLAKAGLAILLMGWLMVLAAVISMSQGITFGLLRFEYTAHSFVFAVGIVMTLIGVFFSAGVSVRKSSCG